MSFDTVKDALLQAKRCSFEILLVTDNATTRYG